MIPRRGSSFATALAVVLFVAAVALLPFFVDDFQASQYAYVGIYFIAICGLNILTGYTGQISLGHGAFMAVGRLHDGHPRGQGRLPVLDDDPARGHRRPAPPGCCSRSPPCGSAASISRWRRSASRLPRPRSSRSSPT